MKLWIQSKSKQYLKLLVLVFNSKHIHLYYTNKYTVSPSLSPSLEDDGPPTVGVGVATIGRTVEITIKE